ncbi:hypothetical protein FGW37_00780 [Streptomyces rectiverticillatus]|nr:hypothetical protein FGW37_00780 [Streptomyces rectiverticillatus]
MDGGRAGGGRAGSGFSHGDAVGVSAACGGRLVEAPGGLADAAASSQRTVARSNDVCSLSVADWSTRPRRTGSLAGRRVRNRWASACA